MAPTKTETKPSATSATQSKKALKPSSEANSKPVSNPKYSEMVKKAVGELNQKGGSSRQAILKYVTSNYSVGNNASKNVNNALRKLCEDNELVHAKNGVSGANGSFKLASKTTKSSKNEKLASEKSDTSSGESKGKKVASSKDPAAVSEPEDSASSSAAESSADESAQTEEESGESDSENVAPKKVDPKKKSTKKRVSATPPIKRKAKEISKKSKSPVKPKTKKVAKPVM